MEAVKIELIRTAIKARENSYAPYSHYRVGAALLCEDGKIYTGVNVENASFGAANCAERTAIFKAVSEGERRFKMLTIAGGTEDTKALDYAYPCGMCRQVMGEFCGEDFQVIVAKSEEDFKEYRLSELLPYAFQLN